MKIQIVKLLLEENLISQEQLKQALDKAENSGIGLNEALFELGYITESELLDFLGKSFGVPVISIDEHSVDEEVINLIPREIAIENRLIPLNITGSALTVAMSDPSNIILRDELSFLTEKNIIPVAVSERSIINMLEQYYGYSVTNSLDSEKPSSSLEEMSKELSDNDKEDIQEETQNVFGSEEALTGDQSSEETPISDGNYFDREADDNDISAFEAKEAGGSENSLSIDQDPAIFDQNENADEGSSTIDIETKTQTLDDRVQNISGDEELSPPELSITRDASSVDNNPDDIPDTGNEPREGDVEPSEIKVHSKIESNDAVAKDCDGKTVLVIDHSLTVQKLMALSLRRNGYNVSSVSDGMEALSRLHDLKPDIIYIEINLPHMDGYRVCKIIKSHGLMKRVPVVMMSGKEGLFDKMRSKMAGANGHLSKPFALNDVLESAGSFTEASHGSMASA